MNQRANQRREKVRFEPGNTLAKGGKRPGAGRPKGGTLPAKKEAAQLLREILDANAVRLGNRYITRALGKAGDRVLTHAIDKLLPDEQTDQTRPIQIQFVQYNNSVQLHAEGVSATVLASNGNGHKASMPGVASEIGEGQGGIKFHDFEDVP